MLMRCIPRRYQRVLGKNHAVPGTLRPMHETEDELARVDELLALAYGTGSRRPELDMYLAATPTSWCVIEQDGRLLAVAGCLAYGGFSWLGLVATHPAARGQGLASQVSQHLVDWSLARGCRTVALDASTVGQPVYERLGFEQVGATAELSRPPGTPAPTGDRASQASRSDVAELVAFDREAFGGDRRSLLRALAGDPRGRWFVARQADGTLGGYLLVREHLIGPAAAIDEECAQRLVRSALDDDREQRVLVPEGSAFLDTLLRLGFVEQRRLAHMRLGELTLPPTRCRLVAQLSYATG
jgi:GNAT superfamily N-acetyltransferase